MESRWRALVGPEAGSGLGVEKVPLAPGGRKGLDGCRRITGGQCVAHVRDEAGLAQGVPHPAGETRDSKEADARGLWGF